jgi:hypothetical protein
MPLPPPPWFDVRVSQGISLTCRMGHALLAMLGSGDRSLGVPVYYSLPFSEQTADMSRDGSVVVGYLGHAGSESGGDPLVGHGESGTSRHRDKLGGFCRWLSGYRPNYGHQ